MASEDPRVDAAWLLENGPQQLEVLFRTIVFHPSVPILLVDDDRNCRQASAGAGRLFGVSAEMIIGRKLDDFTDPDSQHSISERWWRFLVEGEQTGTLCIAHQDGTPRDVEYTLKGNVLPACHVLTFRERTGSPKQTDPSDGQVPHWVQDHALYLLDPTGRITSWYAGAVRMYGYNAAEASGKHVKDLHLSDRGVDPEHEIARAIAERYIASENWHVTKDGGRFWASVITMALRDEGGGLRGFARVVRDFTERHERDEKLRRSRTRVRPVQSVSVIAGIVSGEFDKTAEANDAFLDIVGYSRDDLTSGHLHWPDLTPTEYSALDDLAHEEGLRFGACAPYEKELFRKDGTRVPVLVMTAVLKLSPFQWITFIQDLRQRDQFESIVDEDIEGAHNFEELIGSSAALRRILRHVEVVAPTDATVLILGETGTGKELIARAIHRLSPRKNLPFITLNCAAIPTGLLESELFGYEKGAFTGALSQKMGRFELAHRGTLFLDEVGDIPIDLQPKLLRALQEKSFERLGGTRTIPIDVRLIAATNRNLTQMMGDKLFRSDLYYRLKVFPIVTPPLREHPEDIPILARHFTQKYARQMNKNIDKIPSDTMRALVAWPWPGNVRELENFIERAVILSRGPNLRAPINEIKREAAERAGESTLEQVEREHVLRILRESGGVVTQAAARLGMPRTTLNALMRKLGVSRKDV